MASTSIYLPDELAQRLDALARQRGVSRSRLVIQALQALLERERGEWPEGFFSNDHLSAAELDEIQQAEAAFFATIRTARRSRRGSLL